MVFRFGRFLARSTMSTRVPISGPSAVMSEKMPAGGAPLRAASLLKAMMGRARRFVTRVGRGRPAGGEWVGGRAGFVGALFTSGGPSRKQSQPGLAQKQGKNRNEGREWKDNGAGR